MRIDELTQLGYGDAANYDRQRDTRCGIAESKDPAVVIAQIKMTATTPSPKSFRGQILTLFLV